MPNRSITVLPQKEERKIENKKRTRVNPNTTSGKLAFNVQPVKWNDRIVSIKLG